MTQQQEFVTKTATFRVAEKMGSGTYGTVYKVIDMKDSNMVKALKTFDPSIMDELEGVPPTTLRELNALKALKPHPNVIAIDEVVCPDNQDFTKMFYTMELCRGNLKDKQTSMIERYLSQDINWSKPVSKGKLPHEYVKEAKLIVWQLLNGIAYSHSWGIAHRDVKPANVMWGSDETIKIGDFGLSRFVRGAAGCAGDDGICPQTGEVQTLWYRAPEVIMGDEKYGPIVDDWSVGCIMAELFRFRLHSRSKRRWEPHPLFQGDDEISTLMMIFDVLGTPAEDTADNKYIQRLPYWCKLFPRYPSMRIKQHVFHTDEIGLDLLERLLRIQPGKRIAARFLLDHPWFSDVKHTIQSTMKLWVDDPAIIKMYSFTSGFVSMEEQDTDKEQIKNKQVAKKPRKTRVTKEPGATAKAATRRATAAGMIATRSKSRQGADGRSRSPDRGGIFCRSKSKTGRTRSPARHLLQSAAGN